MQHNIPAAEEAVASGAAAEVSAGVVSSGGAVSSQGEGVGVHYYVVSSIEH